MSLEKMPWQERQIFAWAWYQDGTKNDDALFPYHILGSFLVGGAAATLSFIFFPWYIATLIVIATLAGWNTTPYLGGRSPFYKIPDTQLFADGSTYDRYYSRRYNEHYAEGSRTLMYKIMDLPKEDRKLFPQDLMKVLSSDLLPTARYEINAGLEGTLKDIEERNRHRREMERKAIYHEGIVAAIESTRQNIQVETQTLKDFT